MSLMQRNEFTQSHVLILDKIRFLRARASLLSSVLGTLVRFWRIAKPAIVSINHKCNQLIFKIVIRVWLRSVREVEIFNKRLSLC